MTEIELYKKCMNEIGITAFDNMSDEEIYNYQLRDVEFFKSLAYKVGFDFVHVRYSTKEELNTEYGKDAYTCAAFYLSFKHGDDQASLLIPFSKFYAISPTDKEKSIAVVNEIMHNMIVGFYNLILPKYGKTITETIMKSIEMKAYKRSKVIIN